MPKWTQAPDKALGIEGIECSLSSILAQVVLMFPELCKLVEKKLSELVVVGERESVSIMQL